MSFPTRDQVLEAIDQHAPEQLRQVLADNLRPAIGFTTREAADESIVIGDSKIGGAPDVPQDFEWPMWEGKPLGFLAQFNLEQVAPFDIEHVLPLSGTLSFFYAIEEQPFGEVEDAGSWQVLWRPREVVLERPSLPGEPNVYPFNSLSWLNSLPPHALEFAVEWTWPHACSAQIADAGEIASETYWGLEEMPEKAGLIFKAPQHRLLGYAEPIQATEEDAPLLSYCRAHQIEPHQHEDVVRFYNELQRGEAGKWRLLFQLASQSQPARNGLSLVDWVWGEDNPLYFCIHSDDLAARRFDKAWMLNS